MANREKTTDRQSRLSSRDIVTLAVYLLGGDASPVDVEDIAIKANELAPGRFTWRKYANQVNIDAVRKRLWDAKCLEPATLIGSEKVGWMLTEVGVMHAFEKKQQLESPGGEIATRRRDKPWVSREKSRMIATPAYSKVLAGNLADVTEREAETFFRIDDYVNEAAKARKINRAINAFRDDPELGTVIRTLANILKAKHDENA